MRWRALGLVVATGGDPARAVAALATLSGAPGRLQLVARHKIGRAGLCRLRPQARGARDGAGDLAAVRPRQAGRGVRLRRRSRSRQAAGDGRDRHAPRRPHAGDRRQSAQRGAGGDPRRDRARHSGRPEELDRSAATAGMPPSSRAWRRSRRPDDLLLIAGKGHETGQTIKGVTHHFDDAEVARELAGGGDVSALWTSDEVARALAPVAMSAPFEANGVTFDSRAVGKGDLFFALERRDHRRSRLRRPTR